MKKLFIVLVVAALALPMSVPVSASPAPLAAAAASSTEIDKLLDQYEKAVLAYVAAVKKYQNGDMNALAKMTELSAKVADLSEKLDKESKNMSQKQALRLSQIGAKMAAAMQ